MDSKQRGKGAAYWKSHFPHLAHSETLIRNHFAPNYIPIHTMHLTKTAAVQFQTMSGMTADKQGNPGKNTQLDVDAPNAGELLTNVISEHVLKNIGGDQLVQAYRNRFGFLGD